MSYPSASMTSTAAPVVEGVLVGAVATSAPDTQAEAPPPVERADALNALVAKGFPRGLAQQVADSVDSFPIRLWVVDNSGSMQSADGSRMVQVPGGRGAVRMVKATRWAELCDTVNHAAELSEAIGARTDFMLINRPHSGVKHMTIGSAAGAVPTLPIEQGKPLDAASMRQMLDEIDPSGGTPLTAAVMKVIQMLAPFERQLRAHAQKAVVVIATDGLPNSPDAFVAAISELQKLPVWLVVRLCTDDENVVSYWNDLDQSLEAPLEVLDDEAGEAAEVTGLNPWLTYGPQLHLARELGLSHRLFDLLDEKAFVPSQVRQLCELLLGCGPLPEPEIEWKAFHAALNDAVASAPTTIDPRTGRRRPWINAAAIALRLAPWSDVASWVPSMVECAQCAVQ